MHLELGNDGLATQNSKIGEKAKRKNLGGDSKKDKKEKYVHSVEFSLVECCSVHQSRVRRCDSSGAIIAHLLVSTREFHGLLIKECNTAAATASAVAQMRTREKERKGARRTLLLVLMTVLPMAMGKKRRRTRSSK